MNGVEPARRAVFITVGLGILAYCVAEANVGLALIALPVWLVSWFVTQGPKGRPLPRLAISALVLAATAHVLSRVVASPGDLVVAVSRYLVWLHLIKLYDRVESRDEGQLLTMSVFLVIGASLTSNSLWLGLVLVVYLPSLLWASLLHQLRAGRERARAPLEQLRPADRRTLEARGVDGEREEAWRADRRDLKLVAIGAGAATAAVAVAVFILTPRQVGLGGVGEWAAPPMGAVTGFADEVSLGADSFLTESATPVFDVLVTDENGEDASEALGGTILLRGAVLDTYERGQWRKSAESAARRDEGWGPAGRPIAVSQPAARWPRYTQRISFRSHQPGPVFAMHRPIEFSSRSTTRFSRDSAAALLETEDSGRVEYTVVSQPDAPLPARQAEQISKQPPIFREGPVRELAERWMSEAELARDESVDFDPADEAIAREFERRLQTEYAYTVVMTASAAAEDPIEMFLLRTRQGHCEYFASALAALCRSVGIDARVATGYVATERNAATGEFTVRESNAHAWTEVRVAEDVWRTMDPSPPEDLAREHEPEQGLLATMRSWVEAAERFWVRTVVTYDDNQREALLGTRTMGLERAADRMAGRFGRDGMRNAVAHWGRALGAGAATFAAVAVLGLGAARLWGVMAARLEQRRRRAALEAADPQAAALERQSAFYSDFLRELSKAGIGKPLWRPPMDHARRLARRDAALGAASERLVGVYYQTRFGRESLAASSRREAEAMLEEVRARLAAMNGNGDGHDGAAKRDEEGG